MYFGVVFCFISERRFSIIDSEPVKWELLKALTNLPET